MVPTPKDHLHPGAAGATRTTAVTSSRRTGRWFTPWSATTATTPPQSCCYSNEIWQLQSKLTNYFYPQQKLISKIRHGAKASKKHDKASTPFHRAIDHPTMTVARIVALTPTYSLINPAATQRQIQALTAQLLTMTTSKAGPTTKAQVPKRARSHEATNPPSRAS